MKNVFKCHFHKIKDKCLKLQEHYGDIIEIGGTSWDLNKVLDTSIEEIK